MNPQVISYNACPLCFAEELTPVFEVKDYTVSGEEFLIVECTNCHLRITQDVPSSHSIGRYYKSQEYISHTESKKGLINRLYLFARKRTLAGKLQLVQKFTGLKNGFHLDMGAGTGAFVQLMNSSGWNSLGIEPDEDARKNAILLHKTALQNTDAFYQMGPESFDAITLWHVLEHVHELHPYLEQLKRILKASGRLFIAVPNYTSWDAQHYNQSWAAYDVPRHLYHFSPHTIKEMVADKHLILESIKPMWYDSYYISLLSEKYNSGKPHLIRGFVNGGVSNLKAAVNHERCSSLVYIIRKENQQD
jgi:2-polyprenyl-3-methyl-5-hydroxy-6-metoxy-1,4-benzoquinol methylase